MVKNPLNQKIIREIRHNYKQYLAVIVIAVLAVTLFTGILANYYGFRYKVDYIYEKSNAADGIVMVSDFADFELKNDLISMAEKNELTYEKRLYLPAEADNKGVFLATFSADTTLNIPASMSKSSLEVTDTLVTESFLELTDLNIGDTLNVEINSLALGFDFNVTIPIKLTITGTMTHLEALDNSEYYNTFVYAGDLAIAKAILNGIYEEYPELTDKINEDLIVKLIDEAYNQILVQGTSTKDYLEDVNKYYADDIIYALERSSWPSNMTIESDIIQAKKLLYVFPVIFYLVATLIILTSISQLIVKESKNIGLLKALGYSNREIVIHYTNIFIVLSLIASVIGIILGPIIIPNVMNQKYNILYQLPKIKVPFFHIEYLYSVIILVVLTVLNSMFACHSSLKKVPAMCIRGESGYKMKETLFDKIKIFKDKGLYVHMALRNMKRKISRTLMVILGVMGCSALLVCGFGIEDTLDNSINTEMEMFPFDVSVSYNKSGSLKDELLADENIISVDEYMSTSISLAADKIITSNLYVLEDEQNIINLNISSTDCIVSKKVAEETNISVGDEVKITIGSTTISKKVTRIEDIAFSQGVFIVNSSIDNLEFLPNKAYIDFKDNISNEEMSKIVLDITNSKNLVTMSEQKEIANNTLSTIKIMTNTIKIFAILLALVVLYNLALLNFKERERDIATLKVLGFDKKEISISFLIEILSLTIIASCIGLVLGMPLVKLVMSINENPLLAYIYHVDFSAYLYAILITAGSSILINLMLVRFSDKVKMVESLKSVE